MLRSVLVILALLHACVAQYGYGPMMGGYGPGMMGGYGPGMMGGYGPGMMGGYGPGMMGGYGMSPMYGGYGMYRPGLLGMLLG
ncbi:CaeNaCin (Caenorhabditis bacteriocin) [Caenorhabditis elegans]|uniref:CaeNaCin (Caenorhabditis bacteriocin) n=1 Tax=Caenorhabditis elegans TaxID=6239 RepID=O44612_CAEEL|nr:CaeNaCin (Caenorhabditis bacteriocin) [Caenorhabditis elegans]CCD68885.1 CaeNaCin (Caenorhabditis bacteriocin) [Caenorhabditis elegans]|eukprot:NP_503417.1 CaeNaCin (Caenorhabditis bacteriocin) [Caenorhabditis elegans]